MATNPLKVVIFTSVPPQRVARIIARIRRDAPEARVVGVLYARFPRKNLQKRIATWRKKMKRVVYWRYVLHRISASAGRGLGNLLDGMIRFIHAAPKWPNGQPGYGRDDLRADCEKNGVEILIVDDIHSEPALDFVRRLDADLGLVFGTKILKPSLFEIPKQGSINIHKRKVPDYRGGGAVGLWEVRDSPKAYVHSKVWAWMGLDRARRKRRRGRESRSHAGLRGFGLFDGRARASVEQRQGQSGKQNFLHENLLLSANNEGYPSCSPESPP